jgi:DNA-binding XRE family transcriptional regulator
MTGGWTARGDKVKADNGTLAEIFSDPGEIEEIERRSARRRVGLRLGEIRKRLGLTQATVAARMGVSQRRVSAIENGELSVVQISTLAAYAEALGGHLDLAVDVEGERLAIA